MRGRAPRGPARGRVWLMLTVLGAASSVAQAGAPDAGRASARKATWLAARGQCARAIEHFTEAYANLHDPVILFNRAECRRRIGDEQGAVEDYEKYLSDLPSAPNRRSVEARLAELRGRGAPRRATAPAPEKVGAAALAQAAWQPTAPPRFTEREAAKSPPRLALQADTPEARGDVAAYDRVRDEAPRTSSSSTWLAVVTGVLVVGAGIAGYWLVTRDPTHVPETSLGNHRF